MPMSSAVLLAIQGITAILSSAPQAAELVVKAKEFITAMFTAGQISKEQQDALHLHVDSTVALAAAGIVPTWWQVEPDPE